MTSRQRTELTIEHKVDIIEALKSNKYSRKELQDRYNVSNSTLTRILLSEDKLRNTSNSKMRRIRRRGHNKELDDAVSSWYRSMREQNVFVNGPLLRKKAVQIARMMNNFTFEASNGWLWRWQQKENVKFNTNYSEIRAAKEAGAGIVPFGFSNSSMAKNSSENLSLQSAGDCESTNNTNAIWPVDSDADQQGVNRTPYCGQEIKQEVLELHDSPYDVDVVIDSREHDDYEVSGNGTVHQYLIEEKGEAIPSKECFVCRKSGQCISFCDESFEKCSNAIKFRRLKNCKYGDIVLNPEAKYQLGYHKHCYSNVANIKRKWKTDYERMVMQGLTHDQDIASVDRDESIQDSTFKYRRTETNKEQKKSLIYDSEDEYEIQPPMKKRKTIHENEPRDIYSAYGEYIAHRLRASANERENYEIYVAQHKIDNVIFELSMGSYARVPPSLNNTENKISLTLDSNENQHEKTKEPTLKEKEDTTPLDISNGFHKSSTIEELT